jgi:hypothetical protein
MSKKIQKIIRIGQGTLAASILALAGSAFAQTTTNATTTPGVPTTGLTGMLFSNIPLLASALVISGIGMAFLLRKTDYSL